MVVMDMLSLAIAFAYFVPILKSQASTFFLYIKLSFMTGYYFGSPAGNFKVAESPGLYYALLHSHSSIFLNTCYLFYKLIYMYMCIMHVCCTCNL